MIDSVENIEFWHWWIAAALLLVLEMFAPGTIFLWLGVSAVVVGLLFWIIPGMSWEIQIVIFSILSVVSVIAWRAYLKKNPIQTDQPILNRRGHQYVGRVFTLTEPIVNGVGKIKVNDTMWKVRCDDAVEGSQVRVTGVDGVVLKVESAD
jgi:membrane protein implicated in regulation of membrane protease activity